MARPLKIKFPGAFYQATSRGNEGKIIFRSKRDRVGLHFGIGVSGVSQASRRVALQIKDDKKLKKKIDKIILDLDLSTVLA